MSPHHLYQGSVHHLGDVLLNFLEGVKRNTLFGWLVSLTSNTLQVFLK